MSSPQSSHSSESSSQSELHENEDASSSPGTGEYVSGENEGTFMSDASDSKRDQEVDQAEDKVECEEEPKRKIPKRSSRLPEETMKFLEHENILRRSERQRKEVVQGNVGDVINSRKRKRRKSAAESEATDSSDASSLDSEERGSQKLAISGSRHRIATSEDEEISDDGFYHHSRRAANSEKQRINYKDLSSDEEINSDDVLEWDEGDTVDASNAAGDHLLASETIEKVLKHRAGIPGAVGSATTCYNVEDKGDPNVVPSSESVRESVEWERQFLIKWLGWSHLHNTWESETSLRAANVKGLKKINNYLKRLQEIEEWKQTADKEYIEHFECEREMNEELYEQYKIVERVIAHQVSREKGEAEGTEYYIKWMGLPYSDCTWEDEHLIGRKYQDKIDAYHERRKNAKIPNKNCPALRKRPKFKKLDEIPDFIVKHDEPDKELRDYQLEGVNWMLQAWCKRNSCILADEMGLGKTIQSIAFLSALFHQHEVYGPFLVVVPLSTMAAWQREFDNWAYDVNVVTYMGDVTSRDYIRQFEIYSQGTKRIKVNVLLTTYEIVLKDKAFLGGFEWAVLAVDEAHRLKNDESLLYRSLFDFSTNHRLLITGTPLQNSLKELWALLHFIMPDKFETWAEFESEHHDTDHKGIASLHRKLEPYLLRRVKKDVEKSLPAKVEQILRVEMTAKQKQYYKWILTKNYKELSKGVKGSINGFVNIIMELKKCCNHASLVRADDHYEEAAQARLQQLLKSSGKLILLDKLLCRLHETNHRVLIFSQMVMMLDIIQEYLQLRRFQSQRLDGSMRSDLRKAALDHFNAENSSDFCFLLSTRAGGLGINLATADTVIIFDSDWNPQNDLQAMSRAHRIGQKKQVNIYRFVTKASVEEEIVERAKRKLVLDHLVIQRMDTSGRTVLSKSSSSGSTPFDKHELNAILKFGAEELFKEKEGEEKEPEVDIDCILQGAETRECDQQDTGNELLNSFKYANFAFDENEDVMMMSSETVKKAEVKEEKEWISIIPEEQRKRIEELEREKAEKDLFLGPRQRAKVPVSAAEDNSDDDGEDGKRRKHRKTPSETDEESSDDEKPKRGRKKMIFGFTEVEVRKFIKSFRKFANPLTRLEAIAQDAELEEHSKSELEALGKEVLDGARKAQEEYEQQQSMGESEHKEEAKKRKHDRGPVFKLGAVDVYVRPMLKMHADLEPLSQLIASEVDSKYFRIPGNPRHQRGWDVEWGIEDDIALLRGVYRYGLGSWEAIKMDPDYGLVDKIWLKDKNKKPQAKHLQSRVDFLLRYIAKTLEYTQKKAKKNPASRSEAGDGKHAVSHKQREGKRQRSENRRREEGERDRSDERKKDRDSKALKTKIDSKLGNLSVNKSKYSNKLKNKDGKVFLECVEILRPIHKYMKKLVQCGDLSTASASRYLLKIGDHIMAHLSNLLPVKSQSHIERWHSYLWIFLSCFTQTEPSDLLQKYRTADKNRSDDADNERRKHHHRHHSHRSERRSDEQMKPNSSTMSRMPIFGAHDRDDRIEGSSSSEWRSNDFYGMHRTMIHPSVRATPAVSDVSAASIYNGPRRTSSPISGDSYAREKRHEAVRTSVYDQRPPRRGDVQEESLYRASLSDRDYRKEYRSSYGPVGSWGSASSTTNSISRYTPQERFHRNQSYRSSSSSYSQDANKSGGFDQRRAYSSLERTERMDRIERYGLSRTIPPSASESIASSNGDSNWRR